MNSMSQLITELAMHSKARKRIRRKVCKYLRDHKDYLSTVEGGNILRKIDCGYLGDLTDASLIEYATMIRRRLHNET